MGGIRLFAAGSFVLAIAALAISGQRWMAARHSAQAAAKNLAECRILARDISKLKGRPTQAALQLQSQQELTSLVAQAARTAEIPETSVVSIRPEAPRRAGRSSYLEQATGIQLREVTLRQLAAFLAEASARDGRILPTSLRLSAPRLSQAGKPDTWQAEVVLTHLVFSPESGGS